MREGRETESSPFLAPVGLGFEFIHDIQDMATFAHGQDKTLSFDERLSSLVKSPYASIWKLCQANQTKLQNGRSSRQRSAADRTSAPPKAAGSTGGTAWNRHAVSSLTEGDSSAAIDEIALAPSVQALGSFQWGDSKERHAKGGDLLDSTISTDHAKPRSQISYGAKAVAPVAWDHVGQGLREGRIATKAGNPQRASQASQLWQDAIPDSECA